MSINFYNKILHFLLLEIAVNNSDRLIRLINDILDIERIEFKQVRMKQICDAAGLMNSAVEVVRNMAQKAETTLFVNPLSARIWADCDRIRRFCFIRFSSVIFLKQELIVLCKPMLKITSFN